jgi:hypothetical protein
LTYGPNTELADCESMPGEQGRHLAVVSPWRHLDALAESLSGLQSQRSVLDHRGSGPRSSFEKERKSADGSFRAFDGIKADPKKDIAIGRMARPKLFDIDGIRNEPGVGTKRFHPFREVGSGI